MERSSQGKKESEWATQAAKNWKAVLDKRGGGDSLDADFLAGDWIRQPDNVKHQITRDGKAAQEGYENGTWLVKGDLVYFLAISGTRNEPSPRNSLNINRYFSPP